VLDTAAAHTDTAFPDARRTMPPPHQAGETIRVAPHATRLLRRANADD